MSKLDDFQAMDTRTIVARLRDSRVRLTMVERSFLAALISGEISRPPHRPASPVIHDRRILITMEAARLKAGGSKTKQAIGKIADRRKMKEALVKSDLAWVRKHYPAFVDRIGKDYRDLVSRQRDQLIAKLNKS